MLGLLVSSTLIVIAASETVNVKNLQTFSEPEANGTFDFNYFNEEARKLAEKLKKFYTDAEYEKTKYIDDLKTSNQASKLVNQYNDAVSSVNGTGCEIPKENKNKFNDAQENIEAIVKLCSESTSKIFFENLKNAVTKDLAKVQAIDNTLRLNSMVCFSLRLPPSPSCVKSKKTSLRKLDEVLTEEELAGLTSLRVQTTEETKTTVRCCVRTRTKSLVDDLNDSIKAISDCCDD